MNNHNFIHYFFLLLFILCSNPFCAQTSYDIRLNQVGFLPNSIKYAAVVNTESNIFTIKTSDLSSIVLTGELSDSSYYTSAEEYVRIADFSELDLPGEYVLSIDDIGESVPFTIKDDVFMPLSRALVKGFYYNRASTVLLEEHAGKWARALGHPDTAVVVHPSGASVRRPAGTIISTPYGWYDAGDYNKYVVNSGISTFTLLSAYETYPEYYDTLTWNIPESDNDIPDILDEAFWNIKWMMTMQDPEDGGVYNKTTTASFEHQVMPEDAVMTRYVITKTTAAALDFAAIMAMTARIYKPYMPEIADSALQMSKKALTWAKAHPNIPFSKPGASGEYPSISTGSYGDDNFEDEFAWCAAELYVTTKDDQYYADIELNSESYTVPNSGSVRTLGLISLLTHQKNLTSIADTSLAKQKLIGLISPTKNLTITTPYRIPGDAFGWGGNGIYANYGMLLLQAFRISNDAGYFNAAVSTFDYLLGKNATTYCFVTGEGTRSPIHIHHRISNSDGVTDPVPGLLAGGPNPGNLDKDCGTEAYPSILPAKAYLDESCSYTTNEIAINWSAPLAFMAGGIQAEYLKNFVESTPQYMILSTNAINFANKVGSESGIVLSTNLNWALSSNKNWIDFSSNSGEGNADIIASVNEVNPNDDDRSAYIYVSSDGKVLDSIYVTQNGNRKSFKLEAENFEPTSSGVQYESTTDVGGGSNLSYVDALDWADYTIDVSYSGVYQVILRHAGYTGFPGQFNILIDGVFATSVSVPATGGWQDWVSHDFEMSLTAGTHALRLFFIKDGININWLEFNWLRDLDASGVIDISSGNELAIFPVPASNHLKVFSKEEKIGGIQIISMLGKLVYEEKYEGLNKKEINVSGLTEGIYIVKVWLEDDRKLFFKVPIKK